MLLFEWACNPTGAHTTSDVAEEPIPPLPARRDMATSITITTTHQKAETPPEQRFVSAVVDRSIAGAHRFLQERSYYHMLSKTFVDVAVHSLL